MRIGLLGGSFDPAHSGHVAISLQAIKKLNLQQVWWLITKQNPLKKQSFHSMKKRLELANTQTSRFRIIKIFAGTDFTSYNELKYIKRKYPDHHFVWIMGMDCVINFHDWYKFKEINRLIPIVIFNREKLMLKAMRSLFAIYFSKNYVDINNFSLSPGKFCVINTKIVDNSSSKIRKKYFNSKK